MILFIRNQKNETIVDVEIFTKDDYVELKSAVIIETYSKFLLDNLDKKHRIIQDFQNLSELRGWLWEVYLNGTKNKADKYDDVLKEVRTLLKNITDKYKLYYVED